MIFDNYRRLSLMQWGRFFRAALMFILLSSGLSFIVYGVWLIHPPTALIVLGVSLLALVISEAFNYGS